MPRLRPIAALRERIPPFLRGVARLEPRERSALALALLGRSLPVVAAAATAVALLVRFFAP